MKQIAAIEATIYLKSGQSLTAYVASIEAHTDAAGNITGLTWQAIEGQRPTIGLVVPFQIAAIITREIYN